MADSDPERAENGYVFMLINYMINIRNVGLLNIFVKLVKVFEVKKMDSTPKNNHTVVNIASNAKQILTV